MPPQASQTTAQPASSTSTRQARVDAQNGQGEMWSECVFKILSNFIEKHSEAIAWVCQLGESNSLASDATVALSDGLAGILRWKALGPGSLADFSLMPLA
jgi:hypothetical protein